MSMELVINSIIDLVNKNIIAKTNVTSDVYTGDFVVNVENSFQFKENQEIVLIDWTYNVEGGEHYNVFEYAKVDSVNNTHAITLTDPVVGNWSLANNSFVQKTIGHNPLYENNVLYGDREVIPTDQVVVAVEGASLSNEWLYIQGGLSEEYRIQIIIYSKDIKFEDGRKVMDRYSEAIYQLMNNNIHMDISNVETFLTLDYLGLTNYPLNTVVIDDTPDNRTEFVLSTTFTPTFQYQLQDNLNATKWFNVINVDWASSPGNIILTIDNPQPTNITMGDYGLCRRWHEYIYDARVDNITYGKVSKGSALLRASELSWFGKTITEHKFPQRSNRVEPTNK